MSLRSRAEPTGEAGGRANRPSEKGQSSTASLPYQVLPRRAVLAVGIAFVVPAVAAEPDDGWFLALSQAATGHTDLDATTATRLLAAMSGVEPEFPARASALAHLATPGMTPEALLAAADGAGLKPTMLTLVAAWYTGTVGPGVTGSVVAYADALMYRATIDAVPAQTYCGGGPLWWTAEPPALGVAPAEPASGAPAGPTPAGPTPTTPTPAGQEGPAPGRQP